jgi:acetyl esterase/lipase
MRSVIVFLFCFSLAVFAENKDEISYLTYINIPYYSNPTPYPADKYQQNRCILDLYFPNHKKDFSTIVWFHGGGLMKGKKELPKQLKNQGFAVIGVNYRLFPEISEPVYIEDAAAAVAWVFKHIEDYGGDKSKIFISGHSAGGYLTSMVGLDKRWLNKHNIDANNIAGLIPFSGHTITHFTVRKERGIGKTKVIVDDMAPLYHIRKDAPPLFLITGDRELEMLGRYEENAYLYRMMKVVGHQQTKLQEIKNIGHGMTKLGFPFLIEEVKRLSR